MTYCDLTELELSLTPVARKSVVRPDSRSPVIPACNAAQSVRLSSRGLGWSSLGFERRDYPPATRALERGSNQHLIFVCLTNGWIVRESLGELVEFETYPGCVAVVPAHTAVSWRWSMRMSFSLLRLDVGFVERVAYSQFALRPHEYRLILGERPYDAALTNIAGVLTREVAHGEPGGGLYAESLAGVLAVHLLRHYAERADGGAIVERSQAADGGPSRFNGKDSTPRAIAQALAFIHDNYGKELSLADIASAAHLSPFHLARLFKRLLGVSPHQYLIQLRVNSARWLLAAGCGERSLAGLASAVGFADQSHFTRHFKRVLGVTPRQFRADRNAAPEP